MLCYRAKLVVRSGRILHREVFQLDFEGHDRRGNMDCSNGQLN